MNQCIDDMKVAFVILSRNPILIYSQEIDQYNLTTLQIKYPQAYNAIKQKKDREILVLSGFYNVRGSSQDLELEFSDEVKSDIVRFRDIFIGNQYFANHGIPVHNNWKFDEKSIDVSRFDKLSEIAKFIESLLLFLTLCDGGRSAWHEIENDVEHKFSYMSHRSRQAFVNVCYRVLEHDLKENEIRIRELLYS